MNLFVNDTNLLGLSSTLDLASEAHSLLRGAENKEVPGVREDVEQFPPNIKVNTITILDAQGEKVMGRKIGSYITIEAPDIGHDKDILTQVSSILAQKLRTLLPKDQSSTMLLIGLGNNQATPDSLGPEVVDLIIATRHILTYAPEEMDKNLRPICTLAPGVLGITGIETAEIIKGVTEHVHPVCIIAIDSLAAASIQRVGTTIQLSDTGINPGAGIGNKRQPINKDTMGVPVIAIGVPTVVNTSIIIYETLNKLLEYWNERGYKKIPAIDKNTVENISQKMLSSFDGNMVVTPKEIDQLVADVSRIIAAGIAMAAHPGVNETNYHLYIR